MTIVELSPEDFIMELEIAPEWSTWQDYVEGTIGLYVFYSFGHRTFFVDMKRMSERECGEFYKKLTTTLNYPYIQKARRR